jgi:hypothetical protein
MKRYTNDDINHMLHILESKEFDEKQEIKLQAKILKKLRQETFRLSWEDKNFLRINTVECYDNVPNELYEKLDNWGGKEMNYLVPNSKLKVSFTWLEDNEKDHATFNSETSFNNWKKDNEGEIKIETKEWIE